MTPSPAHLSARESADAVAAHLASSTQAQYFIHQAVIRLNRDASFWLHDNEAAPWRLGVFLHEYVHYLHNFSTVAGVHDFLAQLTLARIFVETVDVDGQCHGMSGLTSEMVMSFHGAVSWRRHLRGSPTAPFNTALHQREISMKVLGVRFAPSVLQLGAQQIPVTTVFVDTEVSSLSAEPELGTVELGSTVLMEGLAWEVERLLFASHEMAPDLLDRGTPFFPYKVSRALFESITNSKPTSQVLTRILLLSLQTSDPGNSFIELAQQFRDRPATESAPEFIVRMTDICSTYLRDIVPFLRSQTWAPESKSFGGRGPAGRGIARLIGKCDEYIALRATEPFFELDGIEGGLQDGRLAELLRAHLPCPVIQDIGPDAGDSEFFTFSPDGFDAAATDEHGAAHGFMQLMSHHLRETGFVETRNLRAFGCNLFGACRAPLASSDPTICRTAPWRSFVATQTVGCWYSQGVSSARGRSRPAKSSTP